MYFVPKQLALNEGMVPKPPPQQNSTTDAASSASVRSWTSVNRNSVSA
jgi:hypothetical protein